MTSLGKGGVERSSALLSKILSSRGYQMHIVTIMDTVVYDFEGELFNLGAIEKGNSLRSKIKKFKIFKRFLKENSFDFIIDNRSRPSFFREIMVSRFLFDPRHTIYCVRSYNLDTYFVKPKSVAKFLYKDAYKIVAVSKEISSKVTSEFGFDNVTTIYNPIEYPEVKKINTDDPYILFYGRLVDDVKNISLLIESYQASILPKHGIKLFLLGDGEDVDMLKHKVTQSNLTQQIKFIPFTKNPYPYVKAAKFTVLTSHYEGFPRSIIESLALGIPVLSVDCKSGPKEIIEHEVNGLLVENYNPKALSEAMNRLIRDTHLYDTCRANAKNSVQAFSMESIGNVWQKLLN